MSHQPQPLDLCGWQPSEAPFDFFTKGNFLSFINMQQHSACWFYNKFQLYFYFRVLLQLIHARVYVWMYLGNTSAGKGGGTWSLARFSLSRMWEVTILSVSSRSMGKISNCKAAAKTHFLSEFSSWIQLFCNNAQTPRRGYLGGALAHSVDQLLDDHVHTLDAGLLQFDDLLLHDSLERHVGRE